MTATVETQELTEEYLEKFRVTFNFTEPSEYHSSLDSIDILNDNNGWQFTKSVIKRILFDLVIPIDIYLDNYIADTIYRLAIEVCEQASIGTDTETDRLKIRKWAKKTALKLAEEHGWT